MTRSRHARAALTGCALALGAVLLTVPVATPIAARAQTTTPQTVAVEITQAEPAVLPDGMLRVRVTATLTAPADYFEVRVRLRSPSGRLLYQKTEVRSNLPAGRHTVDYEYDLGRLALAPGRHPLEIRVLASGAEPTEVTSRLLVRDPQAPPVPVALVVSVTDLPWIGPTGTAVRDPGEATAVRDSLAFLAQLALGRPAPLSLAVPPVLLEQMARIAAGYETTAGVTVGAESDVPSRYRSALDSLTEALGGRMTLLTEPYTLPDLAGLASIRAQDDLAAQLARADSALAAAVRSRATTEAAYVGSRLTVESLRALAERGARAVVVPPDALDVPQGPVTPGCYALEGSPVTAVVFDQAASAAATRSDDAFYDALFDRLGDETCVVIVLEVGGGAPNRAIDAQRVLDLVERVPWARMTGVTAGEPAATATLRPVGAPAAPAGYWDVVSQARRAARAFSSAGGPDDADAQAAVDAVMVAESSLWAGRERAWTAAHEGRAFAEHALGFVNDTFGSVRIETRDVTLSGHEGDVPLTIVNGTGRALRLTLTATAEALHVREPAREVTVQPDENFLTVPVDLKAIIADDLTIALYAGDLKIAESTVRVRASYLDRLATVGLVVVVLIVLLFFIRRRVRGAIAGTISEGQTDGPRDEG